MRQRKKKGVCDSRAEGKLRGKGGEDHAMEKNYGNLTFEQCLKILNLIEGLVVVDEKGNILYINQTILDGQQMSAKDCIGKYVREVLPLTKIHTVLQTGKSVVGDYYVMDDKKHWQYPIVVSTRRPIYEAGKLAGAIEYDLFGNDKIFEEFIKTAERVTNKLAWYKTPGKGENDDYLIDNMIGSSPKMAKLREEIYIAADSQSTVVITGETGSGKELIAQSIHQLSKRKQNPFITVNCSAIPAELFESEIFGYEEGAFTNAKKGGKPGKFELADKGTLFLDEINSLPLNMQPKLLRALQEEKIDRIGGSNSIPVDVRIVCATNQELEELVEKNLFRQDLYFRLNVLPIQAPPLRERLEDIPELVLTFVEYFNRRIGRRIENIELGVLNLLKNYYWPGNVRELRNVIERVIHKVDTYEDTLKLKDFHDVLNLLMPKKTYKLDVNNPIKEAVEKTEREVIIQALQSADGNKSRAAEILKINRPSLYRKMERLKIRKIDYTD